MTIEVESKYELTHEEYNGLFKTLESLGFTMRGTQLLTDIVFDLVEGERGTDFTRIRLEGSIVHEGVIETKRWKQVGDEWVREEVGHEYVMMTKNRTTFIKEDMTVVLDVAKVDGKDKYFVEVERIVENAAEQAGAKEEIAEFVQNSLGLSPRDKAPSYLQIFGYK